MMETTPVSDDIKKARVHRDILLQLGEGKCTLDDDIFWKPDLSSLLDSDDLEIEVVNLPRHVRRRMEKNKTNKHRLRF